MTKQQVVTYIYFFCLLLDILGVIFPDVIQRKYTTFFPIPVLFVLYVVSVKKISIIYSLALLSTFLGVVFFNLQAFFKWGLVFYALGVLCYIILVYINAKEISTRSILKAIVPFLVVYLVPLCVYADAVRVDIFNYIMLYVFCVGFFCLLSTLVYVNHRNKVNRWLLISGILFIVSTILHGYNLFLGYLTIVRIGVIVTFLLMHFAMFKYVNYKSTVKNTQEV